MNTALMAFFHFKMEATLPLYFQMMMGLFRVWDWEMFRLHVLQESVQDFPNLKRPFPLPPNPFASLMGAFNPAAEEQGQEQAVEADNGPRVEILEDDEDGEEKKTK